MNEHELNMLVQTVTRQVIASLGQCDTFSPQQEGLKKVLSIGCGTMPSHRAEEAVMLDISDYEAHKNILRYDRLIITSLTFTQLADIALGRAGDSTTEAVVCALLSGVEVYMTEDALPFRKFAGKGSTPLYQMLEGYARTLYVFGIKPVEWDYRPAPLPEAKPPQFQAPPVNVPQGTAKPSIGRLITECDALELIKRGETVCIPASSILTPSAWDVFTQAKVAIVKE